MIFLALYSLLQHHQSSVQYNWNNFIRAKCFGKKWITTLDLLVRYEEVYFFPPFLGYELVTKLKKGYRKNFIGKVNYRQTIKSKDLEQARKIFVEPAISAPVFVRTF